ncbi:MAG: hypothetical protein ACRDSR_03520 [Pseudonocardiaceae bacterium]
MIAQSVPHPAHDHACTLGEIPVGCTPLVAPQPGQESSPSVGKGATVIAM